MNVVNNLELNKTVSESFKSLNFKNSFIEKHEPKSIFIDPVLPQELLTIIESLKTNTSPGIDGISTSLLKDVSTVILDVLLFVINLSIQGGVFPTKLKTAVVVPIFKSGSTLLSSNYRPISLLSCFSKVFEKVMKQKLIKFLGITNFFSKNQFGFRSGLNTEYALLNFMTDVYDGINKGDCVSGLFLDIKKAFDTVDHTIMLEKLFKCGIRGDIHNWFKTYLLGRKQCVKIKEVVSGIGEIKSGVPQGSVLGAILFIIYVNDLCNARFRGSITSFADDTALCYSGNNWTEIQVAMNYDLELIKWWFTVNNMLLSTEKTKYVNFSLKKNINFIDQIVYKCVNCVGNNVFCAQNQCKILNKTNEIKYLGVFLDSEVKWKVHISKLKYKINNLLRYFYFLRDLCNENILRMLYFSLIQSRIEYGIVFWGNTYESYLSQIYLQQKHLVRLISFRNRFEHTRPLFIKHRILPLKYLFVFKVLKLFYSKSGNIPINDNTYRLKLRHANHFDIPRPMNAFFTKTYSFIAPKMFNLLPETIKKAKNKNLFLKKLKKWLLELDNINFLLQIIN